MRARLPAALRRPTVAVNAVLTLLLVGGGTWAWLSVRGDASARAGTTGGTRTVQVSRGTVTATVTADGSLESAATATATFATAGTVTSVAVTVGQKVRKGQLLAEVDPADARRDLKMAQANLDAAEDALDRARDAGSDTATAENEVTQAELAVDEAEAAVEGTRLTAPMAGTVVAVNGTVGGPSGGSSGSGSSGSGSPGSGSSGAASGGSSGASSGFVDLADLSKLQVTAAVAEADATRLKAGQPATVTWNALDGATATGAVRAIDPQATTANGVVTYGVTLGVADLPTGARPGQTVRVAVVTGTAENVLQVNSAAVSGSGDRRIVTVLTDTGQETRRVQVGLAGDRAYEITSGLTEGERVVLPETSTSGTSGGLTGGGGRFPGGGGFPGGGFPAGGQGGPRAGTGTR
ncbi:efflux RND transporter periplasmic adaptor subunit [Micromonospora carbonacea]|uniref:Efflux RND transporter periplasmic adaptor subunit n=1 Tax=Micromonospora carbonacea TaxID=47853 RepID=A0A7H8XKM7_9ACTN|nr:efflux RND transporter periplasmic adaptor subunit [Micromonospora carbonacea]MBB5826772.1 macrolide-specific efflux system membrane fusion protein [Micromonospora carbonacea]QLD25364.1 efflux RND transporter periplasmic adaptor subunit [Micromonospora carbonacea]